MAADATGNGHDGIIQGPVQMGRPVTTGRRSRSRSGGRGSWCRRPRELNAGTSDFLVSVWVKLESNPDAGETYDIVRKGIAYTVPGEFKLELLGSGRVRCSAKDATSRVAKVTSREPLPKDGELAPDRVCPHRPPLERPGRRRRSGRPPWTWVPSATRVALSIGSKYGLEDRPLGLIDDVKLVIDRSPNTTEDPVAAIRALEEVPPVAWWRLDEAATTGAGR